MKRIYFIFVLILIVVIFSASSFYYWFKKELTPVSNSEEKVTFVVPKGTAASEIGSFLYNNRLIRNQLVFKIYVTLLNKTKSINAGEFELSPSMSVSEIVSVLGKGPKEFWVIIPEGLRKEEIVLRITESLPMNSEETIVFKEQFLDLAKTSEGYLFPDTYLFPKEATAKLVFERLRSIFDDKYESLVKKYADSKFTKGEIVTMASILERETKTTSEKPIVSGILWKRIENGWPLQVDASVQYAVANVSLKLQKQKDINWWPVLTLQDLDVDSPYNTYKYKGLPLAPICNPGLESLQAALDPQVSDYWFYIHSPDGTIHYAKTAEEHAANVRKYLNK